MPPFADIYTASRCSLLLYPQIESRPSTANPTSDHTVKQFVIDNPLENHTSPHLTSTVDSERGVEHLFVFVDEYWVRILRKREYKSYSPPHFLRLHCSDYIDCCMILSLVVRLPQLHHCKPDSNDQCGRRDNINQGIYRNIADLTHYEEVWPVNAAPNSRRISTTNECPRCSFTKQSSQFLVSGHLLPVVDVSYTPKSQAWRIAVVRKNQPIRKPDSGLRLRYS